MPRFIIVHVTECRILLPMGFLRIMNIEHIKPLWLLGLSIFVTVPLSKVLHFDALHGINPHCFYLTSNNVLKSCWKCRYRIFAHF
jgi:hypothetical protein